MDLQNGLFLWYYRVQTQLYQILFLFSEYQLQICTRSLTAWLTSQTGLPSYAIELRQIHATPIEQIFPCIIQLPWAHSRSKNPLESLPILHYQNLQFCNPWSLILNTNIPPMDKINWQIPDHIIHVSAEPFVLGLPNPRQKVKISLSQWQKKCYCGYRPCRVEWCCCYQS